MVSNTSDIITRVLKPEAADLSPEIARKFLSWQFAEQDKQEVAELLEKNNANSITDEERDRLQTLVVLGDLLNILHAQARLSLKHGSAAAG